MATDPCLIEAPRMPGGPTNNIKGLGELWREAKGLESLGVGIGGAGLHPGRDAGILGSWDPGKLAGRGHRHAERTPHAGVGVGEERVFCEV